MSWTLRALLLILLLSFCAQAQPRTLALYAEPPRDLDVQASSLMRAELQRLLEPAGIEVLWKRMADRQAGETFDLVAVTSFTGSCSVDKPVIATQASVSLADTSISDGRVLPFFRIDCPKIIGMLGSQTESSFVGRALARVAAHEIYHIVAQTAEHQERGVAKASFSVRDLTSDRFELDAWSLNRMRLKTAIAEIAAPAAESSDLESGR
jgi:hypothetical protein